MVTSGSHSNGSNLQGLDDPLERSAQSSVSFNSQDRIHYYVDGDATSSGMTALQMDQIVEDTITEELAAQYKFDCCIFRDCGFHSIRSAARVLLSMTYETQSGIDDSYILLPPVCYDQRGVVLPRCLRAYKKARQAYEDFWSFPSGISPPYDFVAFAVAAAAEKPPEPPPSVPSDSTNTPKFVTQSG